VARETLQLYERSTADLGVHAMRLIVHITSIALIALDHPVTADT
jgi:hypothetical protein